MYLLSESIPVQAAWPLLTECLLKSGGVLAVAGLAVLVLRQASAAVKHLVWLAAVLALAVLPVLSVALPAWGLLPVNLEPAERSMASRPDPSRSAASLPEPVSESLLPGQFDEPATDATSETRTPAERSSTSEASLPAAAEAKPAVASSSSWQRFILLSWAGGTSILLLWMALGWISVTWLSRRRQPVRDDRLLAEVERLREQLAIRRQVQLLEGSPDAMPMTWGGIPGVPAKLLLPSQAHSWDDVKLRAVLLHELAHVKRRDCLTQTLAQLVACFYWPNPLAWIAMWRIRVERERASDDLVLASGQRASDYAEQLLGIASSFRPSILGAGAAIAMAKRSAMEDRVMALLDQARSRRAVSRTAVTVTAALLAAVVVPVAMVEAETGSKTAAEGGQKESASANPSSPWQTTLGKGVTVELAGVTESPRQDNQWWAPDGSKLDRPGSEHSLASVTPGDGQIGREFVVHFNGLRNRDFETEWFLEPAAASKVRRASTSEQGGTFIGAAALPEETTSVTLHIGVAAGPWETLVAQRSVGGSSSSTKDYAFAFAEPTQVDDGVRLTVTHDVLDQAVRVVAVSKSGDQIHRPDRSSHRGVSGKFRQLTLTFTDLPLDRGVEFQIRASPYRWAEFRNVSLKPGHRTKVEVAADAQDARGTAEGTEAPGQQSQADGEKAAGDAQSSAGFGPVRQRTIQDLDDAREHQFLDLDNGSRVTIPADLAGRLTEWLEGKGADLGVEYARNGVSILSVGLTLKSISDEEWSTLTAKDLPRAVTADAPGDEVIEREPGRYHHYDGRPELPLTFAFETREGGRGLLQITGYTDDPKGIKIRYKLVREPAGHTEGAAIQNPEGGEASTAPAEANHSANDFSRPIGAAEAALRALGQEDWDLLKSAATEILAVIASRSPQPEFIQWYRELEIDRVLVKADRALALTTAAKRGQEKAPKIAWFSMAKREGRWWVTNIEWGDASEAQQAVATFEEKNAAPFESDRDPSFQVTLKDNTFLNLDPETGGAVDVRHGRDFESSPAEAGFDLGWDNDGGGALILATGQAEPAARLLALPDAEDFHQAAAQTFRQLDRLRSSSTRLVMPGPVQRRVPNAASAEFAAVLTAQGRLAVVHLSEFSPEQARVAWSLGVVQENGESGRRVTMLRARPIEATTGVERDDSNRQADESEAMSEGSAGQEEQSADTTLGPVIERTLEDDLTPDEQRGKHMLDLETGEIFRVPEMFTDRDQPPGKDALEPWLKENSVDVINDDGCDGIAGVEMIVFPADPDGRIATQFPQSPLDELKLRLRHLGELGQPGTPASLSSHGRLGAEATFLFITREGGRGVLQIVACDDDAKSVTLRYRLLKNAADPSGDSQ